MALVPVSSQALSWAVSESGIKKAVLDQRLNVPEGTIDLWIDGVSQPNQTQFKRLKSVLKRPASVFFMNTPPTTSESTVAMRFSLGAKSADRSPKERLAIRDASRIRSFVGDLLDDLGQTRKDYPTASTNENPEDVATRVREEHFGVSLEEQMSWSSNARAFREWRALIERLGVLVFLYSLGEESARGFSFATESPPVVGVSTTWANSVRTYTLFHELGHVLTRTSSSCREDLTARPTTDPVERWCESFAASFLMPHEEVVRLTSSQGFSNPIATSTWLANKLWVSRKSALLRLVEIGRAQWSDFRRLQSRFEKKRTGGRPIPGQVRTRDIVRKDRYGSCLSIIHNAHRAGLVSEADIRTYLQVFPEELK